MVSPTAPLSLQHFLILVQDQCSVTKPHDTHSTFHMTHNMYHMYTPNHMTHTIYIWCEQGFKLCNFLSPLSQFISSFFVVNFHLYVSKSSYHTTFKIQFYSKNKTRYSVHKSTEWNWVYKCFFGKGKYTKEVIKKLKLWLPFFINVQWWYIFLWSEVLCLHGSIVGTNRLRPKNILFTFLAGTY